MGGKKSKGRAELIRPAIEQDYKSRQKVRFADRRLISGARIKPVGK